MASRMRLETTGRTPAALGSFANGEAIRGAILAKAEDMAERARSNGAPSTNASAQYVVPGTKGGAPRIAGFVSTPTHDSRGRGAQAAKTRQALIDARDSMAE